VTLDLTLRRGKGRILKAKNARADFEDHFATVYGARWPALREALLMPAPKTSLINPFSLQDYSLDPASLVPVKHLALQAGQVYADFCASPGGKSLAAIFSVQGEGQFFLNDLSPTRVGRLKAVLHDCVPAALLARVFVSTSDASRWGLRRKAQFDRILLDAPCSGERHLLASKEVERWSLKGSKRLNVRQHSLLCSAFDCLSEGGRLVYSTCSISPLENDRVVEKLLKSRPSARVVLPEEAMGEATELGRLILPDRDAAGPIFFAVIET
jgi:16S rRNA C967 or C1407 C5-methylase (RsmB/RsmF family)